MSDETFTRDEGNPDHRPSGGQQGSAQQAASTAGIGAPEASRRGSPADEHTGQTPYDVAHDRDDVGDPRSDSGV